MNTTPGPPPPSVTGFRTKLLVAMMLIVSAITALALYAALQGAAKSAERELHHGFRNGLEERCRALVRKPRIHTAPEDNAPDLLYPSERDGMHDVMRSNDDGGMEPTVQALQAVFHRFLGATGTVIPAVDAPDAGTLTSREEMRMALKSLPDSQQTGYLLRDSGQETATVVEIIAMPIHNPA